LFLHYTMLVSNIYLVSHYELYITEPQIMMLRHQMFNDLLKCY